MAGTIHLDASFLIKSFIAGRPEEVKVRLWLSAGEDISISAVAWGEFLCGPLSKADEMTARGILPVRESFTAAHAELAAELFNLTGRRSRSFAD